MKELLLTGAIDFTSTASRHPITINRRQLEVNAANCW
jgi:hypothetical protein